VSLTYKQLGSSPSLQTLCRNSQKLPHTIYYTTCSPQWWNEGDFTPFETSSTSDDEEDEDIVRDQWDADRVSLYSQSDLNNVSEPADEFLHGSQATGKHFLKTCVFEGLILS